MLLLFLRLFLKSGEALLKNELLGLLGLLVNPTLGGEVIVHIYYLSEPFPFLSDKMLRKKETSDYIPSIVEPSTMLGTVSMITRVYLWRRKQLSS